MQLLQHQPPTVPGTYPAGMLTPAPSPIWPGDYPATNGYYECTTTMTTTGIPPLHRLDSSASMAVSVGSFGDGHAPIMDLEEGRVTPPNATGAMFGDQNAGYTVWNSPPPDMDVDVKVDVAGMMDNILKAVSAETDSGFHVAGDQGAGVNVNVNVNVNSAAPAVIDGESWRMEAFFPDLQSQTTTTASLMPTSPFTTTSEQYPSANINTTDFTHPDFAVTKTEMMIPLTPFTSSAPSWDTSVQHAPVAAEPGHSFYQPQQPQHNMTMAMGAGTHSTFKPTLVPRPRSLSTPQPFQPNQNQVSLSRRASASTYTSRPITFINNTPQFALSSSSSHSQSVNILPSSGSNFRSPNDTLVPMLSSPSTIDDSTSSTSSSSASPPPFQPPAKKAKLPLPHPYSCPCGRTYQTLGGLRAHTKLHNQPRSFHCVSCSKSFLRKQDLKRHEVTHAERRPFGCGCGVRFTRSDALQRHVRARRCEWGKR